VGHPVAQTYPPQRVVWGEKASLLVSRSMMGELVAYSVRRVLARLSLLVALGRRQGLNAVTVAQQVYSWQAQSVSRLLEGLVAAQWKLWVYKLTVIVLRQVRWTYNWLGRRALAQTEMFVLVLRV